jgi:hypothetical protein
MWLIKMAFLVGRYFDNTRSLPPEAAENSLGPALCTNYHGAQPKNPVCLSYRKLTLVAMPLGNFPKSGTKLGYRGGEGA